MPGTKDQQTNARLRRLRTSRHRLASRQQQAERARIDWARIATVVAVVAGIGTLLFSGVATYYQAVVARDQLEQSRDGTVRDKRDQASRVSFWEDLDGTSPELFELHLMNRSPDPVSNLEAVLFIWIKTMSEQRKQYISISDINLAPCTEVVFTEENLQYQKGSEWHPVDKASWGLIVFTDRDGTDWVRTSKHLYPLEGVEKEIEDLGQRADLHMGRLTNTPHTKNLPACGDSGK